MDDNFTPNLQEAIKNSAQIAKKFRLSYIGSEHILCGLLSRRGSYGAKLLQPFGVTYEKLFYELKRSQMPGNYDGTPVFTPNAKSILSNALAFSRSTGVEYVGTEHVLYALLIAPDCRACVFLRNSGVQTEAVKQQLYSNLTGRKSAQSKKEVKYYQPESEQSIDERHTERNYSDGENKSNFELENFGTDLTEMARTGKLDPVIGRKEEIERVIRTLSRRTKNSPVLVGEAGVGKSAVVEGIALAITDGLVPDTLIGKRIFSLDMSGIIAGSKYRGEFEERFKKAIDFLKHDSSTILFIDEIHNIVGAGGTAEGSMDAAEILKPALARGELQIIGATTFDEYRKYIEKDPALERRFQPITVDPPTPADAIKILAGLKDKYEAHHRVIITDEAIEAAVNLSERYITDRFLPDKAIDLIDEAAARAKLGARKRGNEISEAESKLKRLLVEREYLIDEGDTVTLNNIENKIILARAELKRLEYSNMDERSKTRPMIGEEDIAEIISEWTDIPLTKIGVEESRKLLHLEDELHKRVIGQESAISAVSRALKRARADLKDPSRPNGSFIFVGPTGVGKTELAKALAEAVFGDENAIIRIDMSEYPEKQDISKLIGAPPGYVGYDEQGQLTEKVRRKPYSVVLFDEIEKAHPDIFNLFLQILDDGRLTDSKGRLVDFKNTIIIMTSNVGAAESAKRSFAGFGDNSDNTDSVDKITLDALKKQFRPEFLNRVDEIVTFRKLTKEECGKIVRLLLAGLVGRLKAKRITLKFEESAADVILDIGYDPEYGARPLKRVITRHVEDMLSEEIISGNIKPGDTVTLKGENGRIVYIVK